MPGPAPQPISPADADAAHAAAQKVVETHRRVADFLRHGHTLAEIDAFVGKTLESIDCQSCFRGYRVGRKPPFPGHACLSVNDCVVHGTPDSHPRPLAHADVLKVDIGVYFRGWVGDAAWTYVFGPMDPVTKKLTDTGKESLARGVKELRPGNTYLAWARAVQSFVEDERKFHLVRGLGGHGYSRRTKHDAGLHAPPFVSNVVPTYPGEWSDAQTPCLPGTLVAVEPMIAVGTPDLAPARGKWPERTADGSLSVHYEHDILITDKGPRVLTEGLDQVNDVITR